jgi:large subunit ribosomal protein L13
MSIKTVSAKSHEVKRDWLLVDATDATLGRLASRIAAVLRGKHKPIFTPHVDTGDVVVVINAEKIKVTGGKESKKTYYSHTEYPGGIKSITFDKLQKKNPMQIIEIAVRGMLPKGPLGREMYRKLWVYAGDKHPHQAQQPRSINLLEEK